MNRLRRRLIRFLLGMPLAGCAAPAPPRQPTPSATVIAPAPQPSPSPVAAQTSVTQALHATLHAPKRVAPLAPIEVQVSIPGYSGPFELRLFDARGNPAGSSVEWAEAGLATLAYTISVVGMPGQSGMGKP